MTTHASLARLLVLAVATACATSPRPVATVEPPGAPAVASKTFGAEQRDTSRAEQNKALAQRFLAAMGRREEPEKIASMFSEDVAFEIPGDTGVLPWVGRYRGRPAVVEFVTSLRRLTTPLWFNVKDVLANETRAVVVVDLATKLNGTSETIETEACIVMEIREGLIHRYLMTEDSFEVSRKARRAAR